MDESRDDMTGLALDLDVMKAAKREEMDVVAKLNVWVIVDDRLSVAG